jgi:hypothetical protein
MKKKQIIFANKTTHTSSVMSTPHCIIFILNFQHFSDFSLIFLIFFMYFYKSHDLKII